MNIFAVQVGKNRLWPKPQTAEPLLYVTVFCATVATFVTDFLESGPFCADIGLSGGLGYGWTLLMLLSPLQVGFAFFLIRSGKKHFALAGLWHRLGGNVGLLLGLLAYLVARLKFYSFVPPDPAMFAHVITFGVALFTLTLVVRDVISLLLVESVANAKLKGE